MNNEKINILIVDDDIRISELLKLQLMDILNSNIYVHEFAEPALEMMKTIDFQLVISDVSLPHGMGGVEFLKEAKKQSPNAIRVIFSGFADLHSLTDVMKEAEISYFITKPWQMGQLRIIMDSAINMINASLSSDSLKNKLEEKNNEITRLEKNLELEHRGSINLLTNLIQNLSGELARQSKRIAGLARKVASVMELEDEQIQNLEMSCLLHKIGMLSLPENYYAINASVLSIREFNIYKRYPEMGAELLANLPQYEKIIDIIRYHQENANGKGFYKIKNSLIPIEAKILRICNYYCQEQYYNQDAHQDLIKFMALRKDSWFDKDCFEAFIKVIQKFRKIVKEKPIVGKKS